MNHTLIITLAGLALITQAEASTFMVEAEQFQEKGGWVTDTQFIESMGSSYIMAHGMGKPVADATTTVQVPEDGSYRVWVRTIDWTERLEREGGAGTFRLLVNNKALDNILGSGEPTWEWQLAGTVDMKAGETALTLNDLTGFNGRADAILFSSKADFTPPANSTFEERTGWGIPGVPAEQIDGGNYDLVVVGGGYGGIAAAVSAARMGSKVALVQNRKVLGGNGSSEVQVWAMGNYPESEYPLHEIVQEFEDKAMTSPGTKEEYEDHRKAAIVAREKNITLFLGHHTYAVETKNNMIQAIRIVDVEAGKLVKLRGRFFADCTGHGFIGLWSGADHTMAEKGRLGMSNMWTWDNNKKEVSFPEKPWMYRFTTDQFPYPMSVWPKESKHAEWFWESGFDNHPIKELELTRDFNLLTTYSAWNSIKNHGAHQERCPDGHKKAELTWHAFIGGTRETIQILGDVILTGEDVRAKKEFNDATFKTTWSIDLHYPQEKYMNTIPGKPFIARADHGAGVDKNIGYSVPYRTLYSRNISNLFTAGRNISVDRRGLGTIRVMKTIGMMGVTIGRASALATIHNCSPRDIYETHLDEAKTLWKLPGSKRFKDHNSLKTVLMTSKGDNRSKN